MIELKRDRLDFSFPEIHKHAKCSITFQRTLRIPDDGDSYPLPPGLGEFPLFHIDDYAKRVPESWVKRGGVMLPMYQSEAMWLNFSSSWVDGHGTDYPFAIRIGTGKINAVNGEGWSNDAPSRDPSQDYVVLPAQPWLDGYCVEKGMIRQFIAMPLGSGYTAEEQVTGEAEHGGLQIQVFPMKADVFKKRFPKAKRMMEFAKCSEPMVSEEVCCSAAPDMGLAPGGQMVQEIYDDPYDVEDWQTDLNGSRCFVHIANSLVWREITGSEAPTTPVGAVEYANSGLPWFEYYDEQEALVGSDTLAGMKSVADLAKEKGDNPLPGNNSVDPKNVVKLRKGLKKNEVREGSF